MKMLLIYICVFACASIIHSQNNDDKTSALIDTTIQFRVIDDSLSFSLHYSIWSNPKDDITVYSLTFFDSANNIFQVINDTTEYLDEYTREATDEEPDFKILDINFDGYNDFRIKNIVGVNLVPNFKYYLYDVSKKQFVFNNSFSKLCCHLSISPKLKEIYLNEYSLNNGESTKRIYKVINNTPIISSIVTEYVFTEDNKQKFRTEF